MEVISFNNEYYISLDDIRSIFKTTPQAFELRIDRYEYECKQLVRIYPNDTVLVSCKTAYAFITCVDTILFASATKARTK